MPKRPPAKKTRKPAGDLAARLRELKEENRQLRARLVAHVAGRVLPLGAIADQYQTDTCLSVPLLTANYIVGILNLADKEGGGPFDAATDVPAVEHLGRVLAMAIRNCKLFREVQNQAHSDALTGLRNYRA